MEKLYENIKTYREARGMSQEELAHRTGYSDRSSITKIEKGLVDLQQSKILLFARALDVPVLELLGWDDLMSQASSKENEFIKNALSDAEEELLENFRTLEDSYKLIVENLLSSLAKSKGSLDEAKIS